jgi:hypothetical protein
MACTPDNMLSASTTEALISALARVGVSRTVWGCSLVTVELDSLELFQACNIVIKVWSPYSAILAECFMKVSLMVKVVFQHYQRNANLVVHWLR